MKNPFKKKHPNHIVPPADVAVPVPEPTPPEPIVPTAAAPSPSPLDAKAEDDFTEWCRSRVHGGIERRERNDIFETYQVFGTDREGRLIVRRYHRYPEHEKAFDLSYSRVLRFEEFNRRLLTELDRGDLTPAVYLETIRQAATDTPDDPQPGFSAAEEEALRAFCDGMDHLKDQRYLHQNGVLCCECESAAGGERLNLRLRKLLRHDALDTAVPGVRKEAISGYDIDNIWILGVYNRINERAASCRVMTLADEWSLNGASLYLMAVNGWPGISGEVLVAAGGSDSFSRFGFYSLDFSQ